MNYVRDKSKYVVSCIEDRANWAHLFYEWANDLPVPEVETVTMSTDEESDADSDSDSSDSH